MKQNAKSGTHPPVTLNVSAVTVFNSSSSDPVYPSPSSTISLLTPSHPAFNVNVCKLFTIPCEFTQGTNQC